MYLLYLYRMIYGHRAIREESTSRNYLYRIIPCFFHRVWNALCIACAGIGHEMMKGPDAESRLNDAPTQLCTSKDMRKARSAK